MTTAKDLIEAAYSRSTANDPGKLATDGELLGLGNRIYQMIYALSAVVNPHSYQSKTTVTLVASVGALPAQVIDIRRVQTAAGVKVNVFPVEELDRTTWHLAPAIYRQGSSIVSRAGTGDPAATDVLTLWILDAPTALTTLATTIDARFPTRFEELIVIEMAMYLATKDTGRSPTEFQALKDYRAMQWESFIKLSGLSLTALQTPHGGAIIQRFDAIMQHMKA